MRFEYDYIKNKNIISQIEYIYCLFVLSVSTTKKMSISKYFKVNLLILRYIALYIYQKIFICICMRMYAYSLLHILYIFLR
jgi:hypothetical protein